MVSPTAMKLKGFAAQYSRHRPVIQRVLTGALTVYIVGTTYYGYKLAAKTSKSGGSSRKRARDDGSGGKSGVSGKYMKVEVCHRRRRPLCCIWPTWHLSLGRCCLLRAPQTFVADSYPGNQVHRSHVAHNALHLPCLPDDAVPLRC
jgi:hypothetical protein